MEETPETNIVTFKASKIPKKSHRRVRFRVDEEEHLILELGAEIAFKKGLYNPRKGKPSIYSFCKVVAMTYARKLVRDAREGRNDGPRMKGKEDV